MFDSRASETEFLDHHDCDAELAAASYRFMEIVNRRFGGIRAVQQYITRYGLRHHTGRPLRILDIGSGSCDIPLAVSRWALQKGIKLHFTCLEKTDQAMTIARKKLALDPVPNVDLLQEDVFDHCPESNYDCAVASMCFHHFSDTEILRLLAKVRTYVGGSVLINDLQRCRLASVAARFLLVGLPPGVRHDALLSIRRGFRGAELSSLLHRLEDVEVTVRCQRWFRIIGVIEFNSSVLITD